MNIHTYTLKKRRDEKCRVRRVAANEILPSFSAMKKKAHTLLQLLDRRLFTTPLQVVVCKTHRRLQCKRAHARCESECRTANWTTLLFIIYFSWFCNFADRTDEAPVDARNQLGTP